jgi:NTE family protein
MGAASGGSGPTQWGAVVAARLSSQRWPAQLLRITAIDGAYRRNENTDLATGYAGVLVLSPLSGKQDKNQ